MRIGVIIAAGGASRRYQETGGLRSKLDEDLGGKPLLQRTVEAFTKHDDVAHIVVAGPGEPAAFAEFKERHADRLGLLGVKLVPGGVHHRHETVAAALAHMPADLDLIAVHDAARPCVTQELMDRVFAAAERHGAAIPAVPVSDTLKRVIETDEPAAGADPLAAILGDDAAVKQNLRLVEATVARDRLYMVQTPQVFAASLLREAYAQPNRDGTDDATLVERLGKRVAVVDGDARNIKVTLAGDAALARAIMGVKESEGRATHKKF